MFARLAVEGDLGSILSLGRVAFDESVKGHSFDDRGIIDRFYEYIESANPTVFVIEHNREVIGFLIASISQHLYIAGHYTTQEVLFVRPDKRRTRAAALLIGELISWSDRLGAIEITGGNDNSLYSEATARLLERYGFERVGYFMKRVHPG